MVIYKQNIMVILGTKLMVANQIKGILLHRV